MEIERKFLVNTSKIPDVSMYQYLDINQGYLNLEHGLNKIVRFRQTLYTLSNKSVIGEDYLMTVKGPGLKVRSEINVPIWKQQFHELWLECERTSIHKHRFNIPSKDGIHTVELDFFKNELNGLIMAEVEFKSEKECDEYVMEDWFIEDVTEYKEFANCSLAIAQKVPDVYYEKLK